MRSIRGVIVVVVGLAVAGMACGNVTALTDAGSSDSPGPDAPGQVCTANSMACGAGDALYQCDQDGTSQTKIQDCQFGCSVDHCKQCAANTTLCSGEDLVMCDANGMLTNPQVCSAGCQMERCNTCVPSTKYCMNTTAVTCGANGLPGAMQDCGAAGCAAGGVCNACTPNTTSCVGDSLVVCNAGGTVASATSCNLGCGTAPSSHCKQLTPLYGVQRPSGVLPDLDIIQDAVLNISDCSHFNVTLAQGTSMSSIAASQITFVVQTGGPSICAVRFNKISIADDIWLTVENDSASGFVASLEAVNDVDIAGTIQFTNSAIGLSRGGTVPMTYGTNANNKMRAPGAGGAGAKFTGGSGGSYDPDLNPADYSGGPGGAAVTTIGTVLTPGSIGGDVINVGTKYGLGGPGGGAIHLVSLTRVTMTAKAKINLNGKGGQGLQTGFGITKADLPAGGGGSGGTLVVEAPLINVSAGAVVAANGGGGAGGCYHPSPTGGAYHTNGEPGQLSANRAAGGLCTGLTGGTGGYEANGVVSPASDGATSNLAATETSGGGGGGSPGFIIFRARDAASVMVSGSAIVSPAPVKAAVNAN